MDKLGLPIESHGNLDKSLSGLLSSITTTALKIDAILGASAAVEADGQLVKHAQTDGHLGAVGDCMAKVYFKNETLVVRRKQGLTIGLRQEGGI